MAWAETLLKASFRGVEFDTERVEDSEGRAVARHEYPYRDGADLEDLGRTPQAWKFSAVFWSQGEGDDYLQRLEALLAALRLADHGPLVHPVFGSVERAVCMGWTVEHLSELRDGARVHMEFMRSQASERVFAGASAVVAADQGAAAAAQARAAADQTLVQRAARVAAGPVPRALAMRTDMQGAYGEAQALAGQTSLAASPLTLDPIADAPGYAISLGSTFTRVIDGLAFGGRNLAYAGKAVPPANGAQADFDLVAAFLGPLARAAGGTTANGRMVRAHLYVHAATALCDAAMIVLAGEVEENSLSRAAVETVAARTREGLQGAMDAMRAAAEPAEAGPQYEVQAALRAAAFQVQQAALAVIEQRPPVVLRNAPLTGVPRLLAHALHGDHRRAAELVQLNGMGRHIAVQAGQEVRCYAR